MSETSAQHQSAMNKEAASSKHSIACDIINLLLDFDSY